MKMPRKIPHVYIWSRHTPGCRGKRGKKPADYTRCNCPKQLVWYQWDGAKQRSVEHREAAECFDFETAEERARAKTDAFAHPEQPVVTLTTVDSSVEQFLAVKEKKCKTQEHVQQLRHWLQKSG